MVAIKVLDKLDVQLPFVRISEITTPTIGYPITVPIFISASPANNLYLSIVKQGDPENKVTITPSRIMFDSSEK